MKLRALRGDASSFRIVQVRLKKKSIQRMDFPVAELHGPKDREARTRYFRFCFDGESMPGDVMPCMRIIILRHISRSMGDEPEGNP